MEPSDTPSRSPALLDQSEFDDLALLADPDDPDQSDQVAPPVVAVVLGDAGDGLEPTLRALAASEYPALSVLVLHRGVADVGERVAAVLPDAYVRRADAADDVTLANEAIRAVEGAPFLVLCREGVELGPDAIGVLVGEAFRSNAAIVGPKFVQRDRPAVLVDVGLAIDHYGVPYSPIEPGELDQEQHDAVRDVFFVRSAAMLVRADLFAELGGFDPQCRDAADLDLCWRARLAGARVIVAPGAVASEAITPGEAAEIGAAGRLRSVVKCYSGPALLWVLPLGFVFDLLEALALVVTRRPGRAGEMLAAWPRVLAGLPGLWRARRETQARRSLDDHQVRVFMVRGSARVRRFFAQRLHAGARLADASLRAHSLMDRAALRARRPTLVALGVLAAVLLVGLRHLVFGAVPQVGALVEWPGSRDLIDAAHASWRSQWLGSGGAAPPLMGLLALIDLLTLGHPALARELVIVAAIPLGAWGAYRLARPLSRLSYPAIAAAGAYVANPVGANALAEGRFGPLLTYALAPWLLLVLVGRALGATDPDAPAPDAAAGSRGGTDRLPVWCGAGVLTAVMAAAWPPALVVFLPVIAVAVLAAVPLVGGLPAARRTAIDAAIALAVTVVLLGPWVFRLLGGDDARTGAVFRGEASVGALLRFDTGPEGVGPLAYGLLAAGALALVVARGERLRWAARAWLLVLLGFAIAWVPARLDPDARHWAPEGVLVIAAVGLALAVGLGVAAFIDEIRTFLFGWRQVAAVTAAIGLAAALAGFTVGALDGRSGLPSSDWASALDWGQAADEGEFRILWLGDPEVLPLDAALVEGIDGMGYGITRNGGADARDLLPDADSGGNPLPAALVRSVWAGETSRFGQMLAPLGIRYVVVTRAAAPGGRDAPFDRALAIAIADQIDLKEQSRYGRELIVYENVAYTPLPAVLAEGTSVDAGDLDEVDVLLRADLRGAEPVDDGDRATAGRTLYLPESASGGWSASGGDGSLDREDAFGWANAFVVDETGPVRWRHEGSWLIGAWQWLLPFVWLAALVLWWPRTRTVAQRTRAAWSARGRAPAAAPAGATSEPVVVRAGVPARTVTGPPRRAGAEPDPEPSATGARGAGGPDHDAAPDGAEPEGPAGAAAPDEYAALGDEADASAAAGTPEATGTPEAPGGDDAEEQP